MKIQNVLVLGFLLTAFSFASLAQQPKPLLKRTTYKTDKLDFGSGGTLAVSGAPVGSIRIEGWKNREIEISAEIEVTANSEADLVKLSEVTTFVLSESLGRTGIISVGTHDKQYLKKLGKKFPKELIGLPFKIDYVIKVPQYCDLEIDGGTGDLSISGVDGMFKLNYLETNAKLDLRGGAVLAVFGKGTVDLTVPSVSWRGRFADVSLASGALNVHLPSGINAELDATILRTGKIENGYLGLKPRVRTATFTDKSIVAKSGVGAGTSLKFTVGDGTLKLSSLGG
ncbi:MAG TPA: hypothetical protein VMZ26_08560 [Pyrinomonadaceae bacterium]|nr:hypothetical protein [Pyrinomonadaceae bacterium]